MRLLIPFTAFALLAACGTRGPLELPPGPAPDPVLGKPSPTGTGTGSLSRTPNQKQSKQLPEPDHSNKPVAP
jgi:predicted small lipoprotein YifL